MQQYGTPERLWARWWHFPNAKATLIGSLHFRYRDNNYQKFKAKLWTAKCVENVVKVSVREWVDYMYMPLQQQLLQQRKKKWKTAKLVACDVCDAVIRRELNTIKPHIGTTADHSLPTIHVGLYWPVQLTVVALTDLATKGTSADSRALTKCYLVYLL